MKHRLAGFRAALFLLFGIFLLVLLLTHTDLAMDGVRRGLSLAVESLIPSLFPFLVLSELLLSLDAGRTLGRLFARPMRALFGVSGAGAAALLLGAVCGFPVGATTAVSLYDRGEMTHDELRRILLFANNPSSGFLIGAVGDALFGNRGAGVALFLICWISSLSIGLFLRLSKGRVDDLSPFPPPPTVPRLAASDLTRSVKQALFAILNVVAFLLFFSAVSACLSPLLAALSLPAVCGVLLTGVLEMTSGISHAVSALSPAAAFRVCALIAGFSGLSVCLQIFSVAEGRELRVGPYLCAKCVQGGLCFLLADLYLRLFRPSFRTMESVSTSANPARAALPAAMAPLLLLSLIVAAAALAGRRRGQGPHT